jgi:prepilin-type processing-associated H-X9-DG protein
VHRGEASHLTTVVRVLASLDYITFFSFATLSIAFALRSPFALSLLLRSVHPVGGAEAICPARRIAVRNDGSAADGLAGSYPDYTALVDAYQQVSGKTVMASGNGGGNTIYRLREGIERFMITDINNPAASAQAQSSIAIMWDTITQGAGFSHKPGGCNALYLDGHVEWIRYPGAFPVSYMTALLGRAIG